MQRSVSTLVCTLVVLGFTSGLYAQSEEEHPGQEEDQDHKHEIEELVVTGTLIQGEQPSSATPLTTFTQEELGSLGASDFKDLVQSMSFNASSLGVSATNWVGDDSSSGNASINIRNIGNGATLVLVNGKRVLASAFNQNGGSYVDIQTLLPNIAISRIDVLKDGASALYGSDAVAGVVNIVTRDSYRGIEIDANVALDHETNNQRDTTFQAIYGGGTEDLQVTLSASYLDRGELAIGDRFERFGKSGLSSFGQPGRYVPQIEASGPQPVESNYWWPNGGANPENFRGSLPDSECAKAAIDDGPQGTLGLHPTFSHICVYDYSSLFALVRPGQQLYGRGSLFWYLPNDTNLYASINSHRTDSSGGNSFYPDVRYVIVPEHNLGLQLDAARRGFEPVPYQGLQRVLGGALGSNYEDRPVNTRDVAKRRGVSYIIGIDSEIKFLQKTWSSDLSMSASNRSSAFTRPTDTIIEHMNSAFDGFGGPSCNPTTETRGSGNLGIGNCFYYNSFQTSVYDPVTGEQWAESNAPWAADPSLTISEAARMYQNTPELIQWLQGPYENKRSFRQFIIDWVATTEIGEFRGLPIGFAIGSQLRRESAKVDYDPIANEFGYSFLAGDNDWTNRIRSHAFFSEVRIPLSNFIEATGALRHESMSNPDESSIDPKFGLLAEVSDSLSVRLSWGTSFKVGSLLQTGGSRTVFRNSSDPFSNAASLAYRSSLARGNPDLVPEAAVTFNLGFTWEPLPFSGLRISADWYQYEYSDLIIREAHQTLIDLDNASRCPNGINGDSDAGPLCGVWDHDGDGVETVFSIGPGIPNKVIRREDGYLVRTEPLFLNANELSASGIDFSASHSLDISETDSLVISASISAYLEYEMTLPSGESINGLGFRNANNPIARPMPEYRARVAVDWNRANSATTFSINTLDGYEDRSVQGIFLGDYIGYAPQIDSMTTLDFRLSYNVGQLLFDETDTWLTFGMKNLLNEEPPLTHVDGAYDYYTHDPRGRIYYARFKYELAND